MVATTTQLGDLPVGGRARASTCDQLLQPNSDPHGYEPRPSDARALERSRPGAALGRRRDDWLSDLIDNAGGDARSRRRSETAPASEETTHTGGRTRATAIAAVAAIRGALRRPIRRRRRLRAPGRRATSRRLRRLDRRWPPASRSPRRAAQARDHPRRARLLRRRYGLEVVGAVIPSRSSPGPAVGEGRERAGATRSSEEEVKAIFPESLAQPKLEDAVAREAGAKVGGKLWADSLGPEGSCRRRPTSSRSRRTPSDRGGLTGGAVRCVAVLVCERQAESRHAGHSPWSVTSWAATLKSTRSDRRWIARSRRSSSNGSTVAAALAHDVVVVLARWVRGLVAGDALADVEALDQAEPLEQLERAVDAGQADAAAALAEQRRRSRAR